MKFHHVGFPTTEIHGEEFLLEEQKLYASGPADEFAIEWLRFLPGSCMPEELKKGAHIAFEVEDMEEAMKGKEILVEPFFPMPTLKVGFIKHEGIPIEFMQYV